jgi:hypothetical protein
MGGLAAILVLKRGEAQDADNELSNQLIAFFRKE